MNQQTIVITEMRSRALPPDHAYCAYFAGQASTVYFGYGDSPVNAKRKLLANQEFVETSDGSSICTWVNGGRVKLWLCSGSGKAASIALLPAEVDALIEMLQLGREAP